MLIRTEGIVLKNKKYDEADSLITVFTRKLGKINAAAKGARRTRSSLLAGIQPFCYSDFIIFKGKSMYTINQCEPKEIFYSLRENLTRLAYASYLTELVEAVTEEGQTNNRLFNLLGKALFLISMPEAEIYTIIRTFELKLLHYSGLKPHVTGCVSCGENNSDSYRFSSKEGGILCNKCFSNDFYAMKISENTIKLANYLLMKDIEEIYKLKINNYLNEELKKILKQYFYVHINKYDFKSIQIADKI